jgi:hypothetical protein
MPAPLFHFLLDKELLLGLWGCGQAQLVQAPVDNAKHCPAGVAKPAAQRRNILIFKYWNIYQMKYLSIKMSKIQAVFHTS